MVYTVTTDQPTGREPEFSSYKDAKSYAKTASLMFSAVFTVFENGSPVAHMRQGKLIYSER